MHKTAYDYGRFKALQQFGLIKSSANEGVTNPMADVAREEQFQSPADQLAQLFEQHAADSNLRPKVAPDNKTREEGQDQDKGPHWGPQHQGAGDDRLTRMVPSAPGIPTSSI